MQAAAEPGTLSASRNGFKDMGTSQIHSAAHVSGAVSSTPAEAGENCLFSRRAEDESLDRTDSVGEAVGVNEVNVAWVLPQLTSSQGQRSSVAPTRFAPCCRIFLAS